MKPDSPTKHDGTTPPVDPVKPAGEDSLDDPRLGMPAARPGPAGDHPAQPSKVKTAVRRDLLPDLDTIAPLRP